MGPESNLMRLILSEYGPLALVPLVLVVAQLQVTQRDDHDLVDGMEVPEEDPIRRVQFQTRITRYFEPAVVQNEDEDEEKECDLDEVNGTSVGTWNVGIETTAFDFDTNTVYQCHHNIRIDDLFQSDHDEEQLDNDLPNGPTHSQFQHAMPRIVFVPFQFGAGLSGMPMVSNPMLRILKETMSAS